MRFEQFRQFRERSIGGAEEGSQTIIPAPDDEKQTPDEMMRMAQRQIETALGQDLIDRVRNAPPEFFERLIVNLLLSMGYGGSRAGNGTMDAVKAHRPRECAVALVRHGPRVPVPQRSSGPTY
jgi:restriction system protein